MTLAARALPEAPRRKFKQTENPSMRTGIDGFSCFSPLPASERKGSGGGGNRRLDRGEFVGGNFENETTASQRLAIFGGLIGQDREPLIGAQAGRAFADFEGRAIEGVTSVDNDNLFHGSISR